MVMTFGKGPARSGLRSLLVATALVFASHPLMALAQDQAQPQIEAPEALEVPAAPDAAPAGDITPADDAPAVEAAPTDAPAADTAADTVVPDAAAEDIAEDIVEDVPMIETGLQGHDLSPMGMYRQADIVVKTVMIGLLSAALVTWIVLVVKWLQLTGARARARRVLRYVSAAPSLADAEAALAGRAGVPAMLVRAASDEVAASQDLLGQIEGDGIKERIASRLNRIEIAAGRQIGRGVGLLATIGSVGPFVGLFGTVWGIMNSFIGIAETQTTNLAVVAPGIAEALLATALGLVAAIPAVVIYNAFARATTGYRQLLGDVSAALQRLVSRDLDRLTLSQRLRQGTAQHLAGGR